LCGSWWKLDGSIPEGACRFAAEGAYGIHRAFGSRCQGLCSLSLRGGAFGAVGIEVGLVEPRLPLVILSAAKDLGEHRY